MRSSVDLNCDLGEGCGNDAALMPLISSANIACGLHAGDPETMRETVELAKLHGVAIGAHPSFPDRENFGRSDMNIAEAEIIEIISVQVRQILQIAESIGAKLVHVKPHGALYNRSARSPKVAAAVATAVKMVDENLCLFGLSGSHSIFEAEKLGLRTASETFADRTYQADGSLTPRSSPAALIESDEIAITQALGFIRTGSVRAVNGEIIRVVCDTICIHGDGSHAVSFATKIRDTLINEGIEIRPPFT